MKKIFFVSAGLAVIGAANLYADAYAPDLTASDASKIWNVSGTLRGFYDSNYTTTPTPQSSWGFEFSPSLSLIVPLQQTELGLKYTYGLYYYAARSNNGSNPIDQSQAVDLWIDHAFTERLEAKVSDIFSSSQEPQLTSSATPLPYRVNGNSIANTGTITLHTELSMLFSTDLGYQNALALYDEHGATTDPASPAFVGNGSGATYAGLLNQNGNMVWLNLNYQYLPDLSFLIGYQLGVTLYTGNEPIAQNYFLGAPVPGEFYYSDSRNALSNYGYVGANYAITTGLSASLQAGVQYVDNYNLPSFDTQPSSSPQPYANLAITYNYLPGDYVQGGFTESVSSSSISQVDQQTGYITLFDQSTVLYASINHQITPYLLASVIGHWQYSKYEGGQFDGSAQSWYSLGLNLSYTINPFASVEVGYNYDYANDGGGATTSYNRNRVYLGVTGSY